MCKKWQFFCLTCNKIETPSYKKLCIYESVLLQWKQLWALLLHSLLKVYCVRNSCFFFLIFLLLFDLIFLTYSTFFSYSFLSSIVFFLLSLKLCLEARGFESKEKKGKREKWFYFLGKCSWYMCLSFYLFTLKFELWGSLHVFLSMLKKHCCRDKKPKVKECVWFPLFFLYFFNNGFGTQTF